MLNKCCSTINKLFKEFFKNSHQHMQVYIVFNGLNNQEKNIQYNCCQKVHNIHNNCYMLSTHLYLNLKNIKTDMLINTVCQGLKNSVVGMINKQNRCYKLNMLCDKMSRLILEKLLRNNQKDIVYIRLGELENQELNILCSCLARFRCIQSIHYIKYKFLLVHQNSIEEDMFVRKSCQDLKNQVISKINNQ